MRIPSQPRRITDADGDTMTPMIDVVFLLLVFFICASVGGTADRLLPADLHGNSGAAAQPVKEQPRDWEHPAIWIRLTPAATGVAISLDNQVLPDLASLTDRLTRLATADAATRIILDVHDDLAAQQFIAIYDLCQRLKFENIAFAVESGGH